MRNVGRSKSNCMCQPPDDLKQDMTVSVDIEVGQRRQAVLVATEAVHDVDSPSPWVLKVVDGRAMRTPVQLGLRTPALLNLIGLLDRPTQGRLAIRGEETTQLDDQALTRLRGHAIGFVFQHHHLLGAFTALENVMMPMLGAAGFSNAEITAKAMALLDSVGLSAFRHQASGSLSGGQQQRVAVARALAMNPALLLADEPTGNLDSKSADAVFDLLHRVSRDQGTTVLFVTHNPELAARCEKTIQVVDGRVVG